jgi:polyhydroxyalkanoate synthase
MDFSAFGFPALGFPQMAMPPMGLPNMAMPGLGLPAMGPEGFGAAMQQLLGKGPKGLSPQALERLQAEYLQRCQELMAQASKGDAPALKDKRFADKSWQNNGLFTWNAALYLLNAEFLQRMADAVEGDSYTRDRVKFAVQQWVDALSPANFLISNPEAQKLMVESQGRSLVAGAENMMGDLQRGRISQTDETAFEVGRNVATSPGAVERSTWRSMKWPGWVNSSNWN